MTRATMRDVVKPALLGIAIGILAVLPLSIVVYRGRSEQFQGKCWFCGCDRRTSSMTIDQLIYVLKSATPDDLSEIRRLLGVGDVHTRREIDSTTGRPRAKGDWLTSANDTAK